MLTTNGVGGGVGVGSVGVAGGDGSVWCVFVGLDVGGGYIANESSSTFFLCSFGV